MRAAGITVVESPAMIGETMEKVLRKRGLLGRATGEKPAKTPARRGGRKPVARRLARKNPAGRKTKR